MPRRVQPVCRALIVLSLVAAATLPARAARADDAAAALKLSQEALKHYMLERYGEAAVLYRKAWLKHHAQHVYLYNAARAAQRGKMLSDAQRDYELYLRNAPATSPERPKAVKHLAEVRAALRAQQAKNKPPPPPPPSGGTPPVTPRRPVPKQAGTSAIGWVLAVAGGAAVLGGGYVLIGATDDQAALDKKAQNRDPQGKIIGITQAEFEREQERINDSIYRGYGIAGAGLLAVGVGAYLVASSGTAKTVQLTPGPTTRGVGLAWRF